jgi:3-hydroxyisobutyrate dehydrogenase-like beta-hydroxyacid dehydrogenase
MDTVGFIGLGNMGSGMAGNIQKAGYPLVVYDTRPEAMRPFLEREARPVRSPAEVAQLSEVIFTSLPGPKEVEAVAIGAQGVLEGIKPGGIYVDLSTSRPTLGVKAGVAPEALWECVRRGAVGRMSGLHEGLPRTVFRGQFEPASFALALATELGREYNVPIPVADLAEQIAIEAMNRGWGEKDSSITFLLQEEAAGVEVRAPNVDPEKAAGFISTHPEGGQGRQYPAWMTPFLPSWR